MGSSESAEQEQGTCEPGSTAEVKKQLKEQFRKWDINKDGKVGCKEFTKVLTRLMPELSVKEVEASFRTVDEDGCGLISTDEFVEWLFPAEINRLQLQKHLRQMAGVSDGVSGGSWYWGHSNGPEEPPKLGMLTDIATDVLPDYYRDVIRLSLCPSYVDSLARASPERRCPFAGGTAYTSHAEVSRLLAEAPREHLAGRIERGNYLGYLKLDDTVFERTGQIGLGNPVSVHHIQRKWGAVLLEDFPRREAILEEVHQFLATRYKIEFPKDVDRWWCQMLWRHLLRVELSDQEADKFLKFRSDWLIGAVAHVKDISVAEVMFTDDNINADQEEYWKKIWSALEGVVPTVDRDHVAQGVLELVAFAGGLSVPSTIQAAVAALHNNYAGQPIREDNVEAFVYEVTRLFPAVQSFAWQRGGEQHIAFLSCANRDPAAWGPDADRFTLKDVSLYKRLHVGFADHAKADEESDSRFCPGIQIALDATQAFILALNSWAFEGDLVHSLWRVTTEIEPTGKPTFFNAFTMERVCDKKLGIYSSLLDGEQVGEHLLQEFTPNQFQALVEQVDKDMDGKPDALSKMDIPTRIFFRIAMLMWSNLKHIKNVEPPTRAAMGAFTDENSTAVAVGNIRLPESDEQWSGMPFLQILGQRALKLLIGLHGDGIDESLLVRTEEQRKEAILISQLAFTKPDGSSYLPMTKHTWSSFSTDEAQAGLAAFSVGQLYLRKVSNPAHSEYGEFEIGFPVFLKLPVREAFEKMGDTAYFTRQDGPLRITAIHSAQEDRIVLPSEGAAWEHAKYAWRTTMGIFQTTVKHLVWTHWISANAIATSIREALNAHHPIRRLLHINMYNTAKINYNSYWTLFPENGFLHIMAPFTYEGLKLAFEASVDMYEYKTWPQVYESTDLPEDFKKALPVFEDGLPVWYAMREFYAGYVTLYYDTEESVQADAELQEYWKFKSVPPYSRGLPPLSKEALIDQLTQIVFDVTAYHELVGNAVEFTTDPTGLFLQVRKGESMADKQHMIQSLSLVASTGSPMPKYLSDWSPLLDLGTSAKANRYKEARELHAGLVARLAEVSKEVKARNAKREYPFAHFDPEFFECSVNL